MVKAKRGNDRVTKLDLPPKKEFLGKKARYIGLGGAAFHCTFCARTFKRGMVVEYQANLFCSEDCVRMNNSA